MRILVVGAGIAGLAAALVLSRRSHDVTVIERHNARRPGGYMIDFFGPGYDTAERLGLLPALEAIHCPVSSLRFVDRRGRTTADLPYPRIRAAVFQGRHFNFMRGDLEGVLLDALGNSAHVRFGESPRAIVDEGDGVRVTLEGGKDESFDLVIGADGARSCVRELLFGENATHIRHLGCHSAAFVLDAAPAGLAPDTFTSLSVAGLTAGAYPIRDGRTATFFAHRSKAALSSRSAKACREELETTYRGCGWIVDSLLDGFPGDGRDLYFDDVFQVELTTAWSKGRAVLIGDACACVSLIAGQGASMAMTGAYVLAEELSRGAGELPAALGRYEARIRPAVEARQRAGRRNARWFLPRTNFGAHARDAMLGALLNSPWAGIVGRSLGAAPIPLS
jgi:2-polyprenyl-6-methoxyphenol hydroxylase-like FAD-dependent oxidoreductase